MLSNSYDKALSSFIYLMICTRYAQDANYEQDEQVYVKSMNYGSG